MYKYILTERQEVIYMKKERSKILLVMLLCITMIGTTLLSACSEPDPEEPEAPPCSPLTGETAEDGYDESSAERRVAAFVVEKAPDARPQWGMDDENYSPDIILQGEVEGGITRTLWFYADYEKLPEMIKDTGADVFYHLAWAGGFTTAIRDYKLQMRNAAFAGDALTAARSEEHT